MTQTKLTPEQHRIMRENGTEAPFSGQYWNHHENGTYTCAECGNLLFSSNTKYDSGTGWPSFTDVVQKGNVVLKEDTSHGMIRTEVRCASCDAHLGHVFDDGPGETREHYCINSACLTFQPQK